MSGFAYTPLHSKRSLCDIVKYLAALAVVNGHMFLFGPYKSGLTPFMNLGACCVALFFFFSGYGLTHSLKEKGNQYLRTFFSRRLCKIILPLFIAYAITLPVYGIIKGPIDWNLVWSTLSYGGPYLKYSWFVTEIIAVYILFYASMSLGLGYIGKLFVLTILVFILMSALFYLHQPLWYIISLPGFVVGLWFQHYESRLCYGRSQAALIIFVLVAGVLWFLTWQWGLAGKQIFPQFRYEVIAMIMSNVFFVFLVCGILSIIDNCPKKYELVESSYEVYLMQSCAMTITPLVTDSFPTYWIATVAVVISFGLIQFHIDRRLTVAINGRHFF